MKPLPETITVINQQGKQIMLEVFLEANDSFEFWTFRQQDKTFTWRNNRPLLKATKSNKQPHWQIIHSQFTDDTIIENAQDAARRIIKEREKGGFEEHIEYMMSRKRY